MNTFFNRRFILFITQLFLRFHLIQYPIIFEISKLDKWYAELSEDYTRPRAMLQCNKFCLWAFKITETRIFSHANSTSRKHGKIMLVWPRQSEPIRYCLALIIIKQLEKAIMSLNSEGLIGLLPVCPLCCCACSWKIWHPFYYYAARSRIYRQDPFRNSCPHCTRPTSILYYFSVPTSSCHSCIRWGFPYYMPWWSYRRLQQMWWLVRRQLPSFRLRGGQRRNWNQLVISKS